MKVLVIGGGMSGLTYAVIAAKNGFDVTVAERNIRVGKKIGMSGNGKCNIGNVNVNASCYNISKLIKRVLSEISTEEYKRFLKSCGILTYSDAQGRMYPLSDSASNVVDCFRYQLEKYGGKIINENVMLCREKNGKYEVKAEGTYQTYDKVVLCCGSGSQADNPNVFGIVSRDWFTPLAPSLAPVKIMGMDPVLNGIRVRADVSLFDGDSLLGKESGELLFKDYGLSGIAVFNLSALIARRKVRGQNGRYEFVADLLPNVSQWDLADELYLRIKAGYPSDKLFYGILHNKLAESVLKRCSDKTNSTQLAGIVKNMRFAYERTLEWSMSQVTAGGIDERYVDEKTFALPNGIIALGEVLNVDGVCGGNNLFFASASALCAFDKTMRENAYAKN